MVVDLFALLCMRLCIHWSCSPKLSGSFGITPKVASTSAILSTCFATHPSVVVGTKGSCSFIKRAPHNCSDDGEWENLISIMCTQSPHMTRWYEWEAVVCPMKEMIMKCSKTKNVANSLFEVWKGVCAALSQAFQGLPYYVIPDRINLTTPTYFTHP